MYSGVGVGVAIVIRLIAFFPRDVSLGFSFSHLRECVLVLGGKKPFWTLITPRFLANLGAIFREAKMAPRLPIISPQGA